MSPHDTELVHLLAHRLKGKSREEVDKVEKGKKIDSSFPCFWSEYIKDF